MINETSIKTMKTINDRLSYSTHNFMTPFIPIDS
jgi:hypothetical protein